MAMTKHFPTIQQSTKYQMVFDYFNRTLFDDKLHSCMLVFSRNNNIIGGYFAPDKWVNDDGEKVHEIAINANSMIDSNFQTIMETIIHEMIHLEQHLDGTSSRNGYHNKGFIDRAQAFGFEVIGSGQSVDTKLKEGGIAEKACLDMPDELLFDWLAYQLDVPGNEGEKGQGQATAPKRKSGKRKCYQCPVCGMRVWGKAGLSVMCGTDDRTLVEEKDGSEND